MNVELIRTQAGQYENNLYSIHKEYAPAQGTPGYLDHAPGGYDWIVSEKSWDDDGDVCLREVVRHNNFKQAKAEVRYRTRSILHAAPDMLAALEQLVERVDWLAQIDANPDWQPIDGTPMRPAKATDIDYARDAIAKARGA